MQDSNKWNQLRELLAKEEFPLPYMMKLIGKKSDLFQQGVADLQVRFPQVKKTQEREGSKQGHLAVTIEFSANHADEVVLIYQHASQVTDLLVIF